MSTILRFGLRGLTKFKTPNPVVTKLALGDKVLTPTYSRTLWHMCSTSKINEGFLKRKALSECCQCGCRGLLHTGGEKDLVEFLQSEIAEEKKAMKMKSLPAELDGFSIVADEAELTFKKQTQLETITITMNVNHSVDTEEVGEDGNFVDEMKSKPAFEVDMKRDNKTLSFSCSFTQYDEPSEAGAGDGFEINEITYFEGEWEDKTYSVAADLLDENLYDLFMNMLDEKGITKKFVEKVSDIATFYEHSQYIGLLENVRKFASVN